jgi:hypothetical protein
VKISKYLLDQRGSAIIEFLLFGIVFQMAVLVLGLQIFSIQTSQLAAESIARHALRSFVVADQDPKVSAAELITTFDPKLRVQVVLKCQPECFTDGAVVTIRVQVEDAQASATMVR